jgi:hypothetical protein
MEVEPQAGEVETKMLAEIGGTDGVEGEPLRKMPHALKYEVVARWKRARVGRLTLPHHVCDTPMFMPVGTQVHTPHPPKSFNSFNRFLYLKSK